VQGARRTNRKDTSFVWGGSGKVAWRISRNLVERGNRRSILAEALREGLGDGGACEELKKSVRKTR